MNDTNERGLAPFDEPVYLAHLDDPGALPDAPADERAQPVVAFLCRACVVVALAAALPFLSDDDLRLAVGVLAAVHLPATSALEMARAGTERWRPLLSCSLVALDVALVASLAVATWRGILLISLGPLLIAFHRWRYGRRAAALSVALITSSLAALALAGVDDTDWFSVAAVGGVGCLLVWLVDDQALRHSQARAGLHLVATRAEAVLEGIGDAIVSTDGDGRLRGINPSASHLLGSIPDDLRGRTCGQALGLDTDAGPLQCTDGCALLRHGGSSVEVRRTDAHGHRQPLLASAVALRDHDGQIIEVVHLLRDITALKQADEAKTLFLATASHELKTPLAVISGYAQILGLPMLDESERETAVAAIEARSAQLIEIVDRLLMSSRIDAGHIDLLVRPIPVDSLLRTHVQAFRASTRSVDLTIAEDLPHALTDYAALETVIDHLLDNAHKYTPHDAPISVHARSDEVGVYIDVQDAGIGMTPSQMDLCFERFWQAEGTDVRRFGGTGIGLYIVRSLVQAMHGTISVGANHGPGVTFTIALRREAAPPVVDIVDDRTEVSTEGEESMIREFMRQVGVLSDTGEQP